MESKDTICLLKECNSGTKMAVASLDEVLSRVHEPKMKQLLEESKAHHEELGNEIHALLNQHGRSDEEPSLMAKSMSWLKTNMKLSMDESDAAIADVLTDGCNMGVKSLHRYQNEFSEANASAKGICKKLISIEEQLCKELKDYL